jgi:hypothetical protein
MNPVIYPPTIKTDFERLCAVYPLIEQIRLERNGVAELARSDWSKYAGKFRTYARESKAKLKQLLAERNRLMENIRPDNWRDITRDLPDEDYEALHISFFGDREVLKNDETEATSPLLDELKALNLDTMSEGLGDDPTENLTTYTEFDPSSHISKTADRSTFTNLSRDESAYLYYDKGTGHFDGNFEHLLKCLGDECSGAGIAVVWELANIVGDLLDIYNQSEDGLTLYFYVSGGTLQFWLREYDGGTPYSDVSDVSWDTVYFVEVERDESIPSSPGTFYAYICTGDYYDNGGSLVDSLSIALHTSEKDYRYIYATQSVDTDSPTATITGWMELLDLQEAGVTEKESSDGGSGAESSEETAALSKSETGSGVEQSLLSYLLSASDSGSSVEVAALIAVLILGDEGTGADVGILPWLEAVFGGDEGSGFDALKALIGTAASGSDMRLPGRTGQVRIPSKGVNL